MKVRMLLSIGGTVDGIRYPRAGGEFEVDDVVGANLCRKGQAEAVVEEKREKATARKSEKR